MYELPDEVWNYIKEFTFDWKRSHKQKMKHIFDLEDINEYGHIEKWGRVVYSRWTYFQPWLNTNEIIDDEYGGDENHPYAPPPDLERMEIMAWSCPDMRGRRRVQRERGWWCGYGWRRPIFAWIYFRRCQKGKEQIWQPGYGLKKLKILNNI